MKSKFYLIALLVVLIQTAGLVAAGQWMTSSTLQVSEPGLIESIVPPELHRTRAGTTFLDLSLAGPDGKFRAFELFQRSGGNSELIQLTGEKATLLDDRRILWQASLVEGYLYNSMRVMLKSGNYAGKVDFEGLVAGNWVVLATGAPIVPYAGAMMAGIDFPEAAYEKIRCHFTGFDEYFKQTPVFVQSVQAAGRRIGSDYAYRDVLPQIEQSPIDGGVEVRLFLPGSGLMLENIELTTTAQFKGSWKIGRERLVLGNREFAEVFSGTASGVDGELQKLVIDMSGFWESRVILVRMISDNYFGRIEHAKATVKLPRILFVADQPGEYSLQTGHNREASVLFKPESQRAAADKILEFSAAAVNSQWQAESLLKTYSAKGGPFSADGYTWKAGFTIGKPGFYKVIANEQISLDRQRDSWRIVKDDVQIPYFLGGQELRELAMTVETNYDAAANRTVYLFRLPEKSVRFAALKFKARGIFNRSLRFEKHEAGQISWQYWQSHNWVNQVDQETAFTLNLSRFPEDQNEIRLTVEHGSNQPLEIVDFKGLYPVKDLYFIAGEPGRYNLMGGNAATRAPVYDLAMVEEELSELSPETVVPESVEAIDAGTADSSGPVDQGAPFIDSGYSWVATFTVPAPGFYQLGLNLKASLDSNPAGLRLVRNGLQVPFFPGSSTESGLEVKFSSEYDRDKNTTWCPVELPVASKQWRSLQFSSTGIFSRNLVLEIRKPGKLGWKTFATSTWTSRSDGPTTHSFRIDRLPEGETELRLAVAHGDNSPVNITGAMAYYQSHTMLFQAAEAGEYQIYGGNSKARAPRYDLALIKDNMLKNEPRKLQLGDPAEFSGASQVGRQIEDAFSDRGWGIYAVLGLVTALLLFIIIRLFPEDKKPEQAEEEHQEDTKE